MEGTAGAGDFVGNWTYRSFENKPALDTSADQVLLAVGDLKLEVECAGDLSAKLEAGDIPAGLDIGCSELSGQVLFGALRLTVSGAAKSGNPPTIRFRATGVAGTFTAGWIYDYVGYLAPSWPRGVGQLRTIVGTLIRTVEHEGGDGGIRPAGATLSFIAVSRDDPADR